VRRLGGNGSNDAFLNSDDFRELFLPIIKADFAVADSFVCDTSQHIACDMVLCGGARDPEVSVVDLVAWGPFTRGNVTRTLVSGGHFAPWENPPLFLGFLKDVLDRYVGPGKTNHWGASP
jgi:surfactin synthase thioesterase subunit